MTADALAMFLKGWGALLLGSVGTILGLRAELRSRREHRWKVEDRRKQEAREAAEAERLAWCREMQKALEANPNNPVLLAADKLEWATWGDGQYFRLNTDMPGEPLLVRLRRPTP